VACINGENLKEKKTGIFQQIQLRIEGREDGYLRVVVP
jgi:hypothetical protein